MDLGKHPSGLTGKFHSSLIRYVLEAKDTFSNDKMSILNKLNTLGKAENVVRSMKAPDLSLDIWILKWVQRLQLIRWVDHEASMLKKKLLLCNSIMNIKELFVSCQTPWGATFLRPRGTIFPWKSLAIALRVPPLCAIRGAAQACSCNASWYCWGCTLKWLVTCSSRQPGICLWDRINC